MDQPNGADRSMPSVSTRVLLHQGFDEHVVAQGKQLVNHLHVLLRTAQIHEPGNIALEAPLDHVLSALDDLRRWRPEVNIKLEGDSLFLDDVKLKMDIDSFTSFASIINLLKRNVVGTITFHRVPERGELLRFVYLLAKADAKPDEAFDRLAAGMRRAGIAAIEIDRYEEEKDPSDELLRDAKDMAKSVYFKTMTAVSEVMEDVKLGQAVSVKRAKRVVQSMVDFLLQEETTLLGLTTLRSHDVYTHNHSVNVCVLALSLAQRLGYAKKQLTEVGVAALFHDLGKAVIPPEVLNKSTDFSEEDWRVMRRHPVLGVKLILKLKGINETTIRMVMGVFEHHLNLDISGYPKLDCPWQVSLLGRMVSICDCYDALTSSRVYNRIPYTPEKALKFMLSKSGTAFDPLLMKIFVNCIGIFPIGALVMLNTKELAVVTGVNPDPEKAERPRVRIIADAAGNEILGESVDLSAQNEKTGAYLRSIVRTIDPFRYKIDVSRYFL